jgi:hypothetical protein
MMVDGTENGAAVAAVRRLITEHNLDQANFLLVVAAVLKTTAQERARSSRISLAQWTPTEDDWDGAARLYAQTGIWSPQFGPDPELPGCKCPPEILAKWRKAYA